MTEPRGALSSPSTSPLPPNDSLPKRYKVIWRVLLISNFTLAAYMFASARKKDLGGMVDDGVGEHISGKVTTKIPSKFMVDAATIGAENIPKDELRQPFQ